MTVNHIGSLYTTTVFLSQLLPTGGSDLQEKLRVLVNQAIVGLPPPARLSKAAPPR